MSISNLLASLFGPASQSSDLKSPRQREEEKAIEIHRIHSKKRNELRLQGQIALGFLRKEVFVRGLVLDSNIWMNERYEVFFDVLAWLGRQGYGAKPSRRLTLPKVQFDEICLKKSNTDYGTPPNSAARIALRRIERLQTEKLLSVDASFEAERKHGDPQLLRMMTSMAAKGIVICFISDDIEFRIRAREILVKCPAAKWRLLEMADDVIPKCHTIIAASKVGANPSFYGNATTSRSNAK